MHGLKGAWFQPLNLNRDLLVSSLCFQIQRIAPLRGGGGGGGARRGGRGGGDGCGAPRASGAGATAGSHAEMGVNLTV